MTDAWRALNACDWTAAARRKVYISRREALQARSQCIENGGSTAMMCDVVWTGHSSNDKNITNTLKGLVSRFLTVGTDGNLILYTSYEGLCLTLEWNAAEIKNKVCDSGPSNRGR